VRGAKSAKDGGRHTAWPCSKQIKKVGVISGVCGRKFIGYPRGLADERSRSCPPDVELRAHAGDCIAANDKAMEKFGFAMGPLRVSDLSRKRHTLRNIRKRMYVEYPHSYFPDSGRIGEWRGRFGQKTGDGWYGHKPSGDRAPIPSELVTTMRTRRGGAVGVSRHARSARTKQIVRGRCLSLTLNGGDSWSSAGDSRGGYRAARGGDHRRRVFDGYVFQIRGGACFYEDKVGYQHPAHDEAIVAIAPPEVASATCQTRRDGEAAP